MKRTDFVTSVRLSEKEMCSTGFPQQFVDQCRGMAPLVKFVTRALDLAW